MTYLTWDVCGVTELLSEIGSWKHRRDTLLRIQAALLAGLEERCSAFEPMVKIHGHSGADQLQVRLGRLSAASKGDAEVKLRYWVARLTMCKQIPDGAKLTDIFARGSERPPAKMSTTNQLESAR